MFSQPLSGSVIKKGQTALMCGLCENDPKLKWKCLDCGLMMCQRCRDKVHPKFPSAEDHTILDIKEIGKHQTESEPKPDLTRIKCGIHSGENCCFYCKTCECLVCQTCVTQGHKRHEFIEIKDEYEIKFKKIQDDLQKIKKEMQPLMVNEKKLKQTKSTEQSKYEKVKQEILDQEKALVDEIKKHSNKLLKELDQKWEAVSQSIDCETKEVKDKLRQIKEQQKKIYQLLQVENARDVFSTTGAIFQFKEVNIRALKQSITGVPKFIHGDKTKISQILGNLKEITIQMNTKPQVKAQYKTELTCISSVLSSPDGGLWICDNVSGNIKKVTPKADNLNVIYNIDIKVYAIALIPSGDLLLSVFGSSTLKLVSYGSTDIQDSVYTVSPLQPTGIHITKGNKVIIGVREIGKSFPIKGTRKVILINQNGQEEKCFQYDKNNKPLFSLPLCLTDNSKGSITVVDTLSDDHRGRVVVLDQEGEVRNIYTGHPDVNKGDKPFSPRGITTTPSDNFVVADLYHHTLHILNSEGEIITFYNTKEMGILLPHSMSFSSSGQLYIGCSTYANREEKAKLFAINNFLF